LKVAAQENPGQDLLPLRQESRCDCVYRSLILFIISLSSFSFMKYTEVTVTFPPPKSPNPCEF